MGTTTTSTTQDTATITAKSTVTADDLLGQRLRHASIEALIQALLTLTHRVHGRHDAVSDRIREQREYVIVEIKRRTGTGSHGGAA